MAIVNEKESFPQEPRKMRLIPFLGSFLAVALLFAVQQYLGARMWYPKAHVKLPLILAGWELQYFLWGVFCWALWRWHGDKLRRASWRYLLFVMLPLSIVMGIAVEMTLVAAFRSSRCLENFGHIGRGWTFL